ncbi:MAG TPA: serine/threonine-protein kinase [Pyrinomonadaceae bacterium]
MSEAFDKMSVLAINKMLYCPKCQQTFEDAAQRFCLNDGARLLPAPNSPKSAAGASGVFTSLLGKRASNESLEDKFASMPRFTALEPLPETSVDSLPEKRFFTDDDEIELELEPKENAAVKPSARSVKPDEVPSGTAEVGDRKTNPVNRAALSRAEPRVLIGQAVKNRYEIVELLGKDETGLDYLAEDRLAQRKKVFVRVLIDDEGDANGGVYAEEIVSLSHVNHPNIARVIDSGELIEGNPFVVSEYVEADSIRDLMKKAKQFNAHRAARIIRQAAGALSEAHQNGVLHRNLKPESVLLTINEAGAEQVKLTNFGSSSGGSRLANLIYQAPEILDGKPATFASDIYSLAVIAYQMLTNNRLPFSAETARDLMKAQRGGLSVPPTNLRDDLPASVDAILAKALSFEPGARYPKARDFGDAFYNALLNPSENNAEIAAPEKTDSFAAVKETTIPKNAENEILDEEKNEVDNAKSEFADVEIVAAGNYETENRGAAEDFAVDSGAFVAPRARAAEIPETKSNGDLWTRRSPEPPQTNSFNLTLLSLLGLLLLLSAVLCVWFYSLKRQTETDNVVAPPQNIASEPANAAPITAASSPASTLGDIEVPPLPRNIEQPPDTVYFQNSRQSLKGDLVRNFLGFSLYYPKSWQINEVTESRKPGTRGKFLDISKTIDGRLSEQMLVSYYDSRGTFKEDAARFPQLVRETNETLKTLIPNYHILSEGETTINGGWRAYEVKFQGGGIADGEKMIVWGRRLFIPAARQGARSGYEITMLATSLAPDVLSVDDVGTKGELAEILQTFEPNGNF